MAPHARHTSSRRSAPRRTRRPPSPTPTSFFTPCPSSLHATHWQRWRLAAAALAAAALAAAALAAVAAAAVAAAAVAVPCAPPPRSPRSPAQVSHLIPPGVPVISLSKGIETSSLMLMAEVLEDCLGSERPLAFLSGPAFASEIAEGLVTAVTIASAHTTPERRTALRDALRDAF